MQVNMLNETRGTQQPVITPPQEAILRELLTYFYLTSHQVCRLLYSPGSLTYVQTSLKRLTDAGFCQRIFLPRPTQHGSAPSVYTLANRGLNYLRALGTEVPTRYRPSEEAEHSYLFLRHTLFLNDSLIAIQLLTRRYPQINIDTMLHERTLKHEPMYVQDADGNKQVVVMDAWLDLNLNGSQRMCLGLEIDMGTEEQRKWRRKSYGLARVCSQGLYQERFGTNSLTIAVLASGQRRLSNLLRWTELELADLPDKDDAADLFRFTTLPAAEATPEQLFCSPCWYKPFSSDRMPLIDPPS